MDEDRGPVFATVRFTVAFMESPSGFGNCSMRVDAEVLGIQWAQKVDTRITRSGALLRQLRIDGYLSFGVWYEESSA